MISETPPQASPRRRPCAAAGPLFRGLGLLPLRPIRMTLAGEIIFPVLAPHLAPLLQRGQRVRDRHLAGLVALQPHLLQDFAAGHAVAAADQLQKRLAFAAATSTR